MDKCFHETTRVCEIDHLVINRSEYSLLIVKFSCAREKEYSGDYHKYEWSKLPGTMKRTKLPHDGFSAH
jgi:hypothetical protein